MCAHIDDVTILSLAFGFVNMQRVCLWTNKKIQRTEKKFITLRDIHNMEIEQPRSFMFCNGFQCVRFPAKFSLELDDIGVC